MIRFRYTEDERRYYTLVGQAYRLMARHMPPQAVSEAMRAIGKTQEMLQLEGIRQGVAAAALADELHRANAQILGMPPDGPKHAKAFQLHAIIYGSSDTPLRAVETERLGHLGLSREYRSDGWLDDAPLRFAPSTEAEFAESEMESHHHEPVPEPVRHAPSRTAIDDFQAHLGDDDESLDAQEFPELLDRIRDSLRGGLSGGWKPANWQELIIRLHMELHVDAGFLDLQLSTEMGRTVLAQVGLLDIQPAFGFDLNETFEAIRERQAEEAT